VSTLGDETLDFYQFDEDLKMEDIIPDINMPAPEDIVANKELRRSVSLAIAGMPGRWREALLETGKRKKGRKDARPLELARLYLRERLRQLGYSFRSDPGKRIA
jgi:hypothetical protein